MKYLVIFAIIGYFISTCLASSYYRSVNANRSPNHQTPARKPVYHNTESAYEVANLDEDKLPSPYNFVYNVEDSEANQERSESGDENGNIKGSYGYTDANGVYRKVEYTAGPDGFHAIVSSNEPGLGLGEDDNPADVKLNVQKPPAGAYNIPKKNKVQSSSRNLYSRPNY